MTQHHLSFPYHLPKHRLLARDSLVLQALSHVPFELAVGTNGTFWVSAEDGAPKSIIAVINAILNSEGIHTKKEIEAMCKHVLQASASAKR